MNSEKHSILKGHARRERRNCILSHTLFFKNQPRCSFGWSFPDQPLKLLHLRGVSLYLLLIKTGLNCQNLLEILCLGDLLDQRES